MTSAIARIEILKIIPLATGGGVKALVNVLVNGWLGINGIRIIHQPGKGAWAALPQRNLRLRIKKDARTSPTSRTEN